METTGLFLKDGKLPDPLSKEEVYCLLKKAHEGDYIAREKIINHNIRLVIYKVMNNYKTVLYDKKDLVSIGIIGLVKAVDSFDTSKNVEFSTYAARCIDNEILMFIRKLKVRINVVSFNEVVCIDDKRKNIELEDTISDETNIEDEYLVNEEYQEIRKLVSELPDYEQEIIKLFFGFYGKRYTQNEISQMFNVTQPYVSRLIKKILINLKEKLQEDNALKSKKLIIK